jgi:hypothetical protein
MEFEFICHPGLKIGREKRKKRRRRKMKEIADEKKKEKKKKKGSITPSLDRPPLAWTKVSCATHTSGVWFLVLVLGSISSRVINARENILALH